MYTRNIVYLLIGLLLIALPASAQDSQNWFIYLFDNINYNLIRVDSTGATETFSLGIDDNSFVNFNDMAINQDGTRVAFCEETRTDMNSILPGQKTVVVRDIVKESNLRTMDYGNPYGCSVSAFSEDSSEIAVSLVNELPYMPNFVDTPAPTWELQLIDLSTGYLANNIAYYISEMPNASFFGQDVPLLADVRLWNDHIVRFAGMPYLGTDGPPEVPVYEWNLKSGSIKEMPPSTGRMNNDYLPGTGELVYAALDDRLASVVPGGPIALANVVNIRDEAGNFRTIYQNTEWVIAGTTFISDGQSIAISLFGAWDDNNPELSAMARYEVLNRDGSIQKIEASFEGYKEIAAVPGGAVLTWTINPTADGYQPTYVAYWDGSFLNTVVEFTPDYTKGFSPPMLVWSPAIGSVSNIPDFAPIQ